MEITIASWNIAGAHTINSEGQFDYNPEDTKYFAKQLQLLSPDVVCLQETHINERRSVAKEIAETLGDYTCIEQNNSPSHISSEYNLGNAILTKLEVKDVMQELLPYPDFSLSLPNGAPAVRHEKGFQFIEFTFGSILNTQLLPLKFLGNSYESPEGKDFASKIEERLLDKASSPSLICGDLNYDKAASLYDKLLKDMKTALPHTPTRPNGGIADYIFYSDEIKIIDSGISETKTDHYLCWAKFGM